MSLISGRDFNGSADTTSVISNEAAINCMRIKEPLNKLINFQGKELRIAGIMKDALMTSPFDPAESITFFRRPGQQNPKYTVYHPLLNRQKIALRPPRPLKKQQFIDHRKINERLPLWKNCITFPP
ncbi:ABC transporter permease [Longitalea arenae]|uniref:ABC transporter permease n=1 Tax=Longitalea arenae TaxID=2812558 RepID=UPI001967B33D|nr:ABC transporter permease [Longitalea arenae]